LDHKNTIKHDNSWSNLRKANDVQNQANRGAPTNNTSGFKGVHWHKPQKEWHARITDKGRRIHLGSFDDPIKAHEAYKKAAIDLWGEFARF
jgi:hypothetical protein